MQTLNHNFFIILFSGIAFFMFGMNMTSRSIEKLAANNIRKLLNKLSNNYFMALFIGIAITTLLQSSSALTSMLVGLGTAGVINLSQVIGVIIGTAIGSTITVQLISFKITNLGLPIFLFSFLVFFTCRQNILKNISSVFMGFGLMFFGIELISIGSYAVTQIKIFDQIAPYFHNNYISSLLISMTFCAFVQSSAATIGLAMGFANAGIITLTDALFWVYGANIGTTTTALIASIGGNYVGKQIAWAHFFYKSIIALIFASLTPLFVNVLDNFSTNIQRSIANGHLIVNVIGAIIFYPFSNILVKAVEYLIPEKEKDKVFSTKFINRENYSSPAIAESYAVRELMRMADIVVSMIKDSILLFKGENEDLFEDIRKRDNMVDFLFREIKMFLLEQDSQGDSGVNNSYMEIIVFAGDLERAADAVDNNILELARKKNALKLEFSEEGQNDINLLHKEVVAEATIAINEFTNKELSNQAIKGKRKVRKLELQLREAHIERLKTGHKETINTSSIHLDLLSEYRRVSSLLCAHVYQS